MAFLCPSRKSRQKKKKKEEKEPYLGRITGSSSIDTLVRVGLEKQHGLTTESRMAVLDDFQACAADEVGVERGQVVFMLYTEHEWMYILREDGREGFIPRSFVKPCRSPAQMKRKPPTPLSQIRGGSEDDDGNDGDESNSPTNSSSQAAVFPEVTSPDPEDGEVAQPAPASPASEDDMTRRDSIQSLLEGDGDDEATDDVELPDILPFGKRDQGKWVALAAYDVMQENDVKVTSGEVLTLLNSDDKDWYWVRRSSGAEGFVPRSYLCKLPDDFRIKNNNIHVLASTGRGLTAHRAAMALKLKASNGHHRSLSLTDHREHPRELSLPSYLKPPLYPAAAARPSAVSSSSFNHNPVFLSAATTTTTTTITTTTTATATATDTPPSSTSFSGCYNVTRAELIHNAAVRAAAVFDHGAAANRRGSSSSGFGGAGAGGGTGGAGGTGSELSSALAGRPPRPHSSMGYSSSSSLSLWMGSSDQASNNPTSPVSPAPGVGHEELFASSSASVHHHHQGKTASTGLHLTPPYGGWSQRNPPTSGTPPQPTSGETVSQGQTDAQANAQVADLPPPYLPPPHPAQSTRERSHSSLGNLTHARRASAGGHQSQEARAHPSTDSASSRAANSHVAQRPHSAVGFATAEFVSAAWEGSGGLRKPISLPASAGHIPPASAVAGRSRPGSPLTDDPGAPRFDSAAALNNNSVINSAALPSSPTSPGVAGPSAHRYPVSHSGPPVPPKTPPPSLQNHASSPSNVWPSSSHLANPYTPYYAPPPSQSSPNHRPPPPSYPSNHHHHSAHPHPQPPSHPQLPPPYPANPGALPPPYPSNHQASPQQSPSHVSPSSASHSPTSPPLGPQSPPPLSSSTPSANHKHSQFVTAANRFATSDPPRQTLMHSHLSGAGLSASLNHSYGGRRSTLAQQNSAPGEISSSPSPHSPQHAGDTHNRSPAGYAASQQSRPQWPTPQEIHGSVIKADEAVKSRIPTSPRRHPAVGNPGRSTSPGRELQSHGVTGGEGVVTELMTLHKFSGRGADDISVDSEEIVYCDVSKQPERDWLWVFSPRLQRHGFIPRDNVTVPRRHSAETRTPSVARV